MDIFKKAWKTQGVANKFKAVFYGPGWVEGGPRMGDPSQLPEVHTYIRRLPFVLASTIS